MNGIYEDNNPQECYICIFNPDRTCEDCSEKGFYMQILVPNPDEILENMKKTNNFEPC